MEIIFINILSIQKITHTFYYIFYIFHYLFFNMNDLTAEARTKLNNKH